MDSARGRTSAPITEQRLAEACFQSLENSARTFSNPWNSEKPGRVVLQFFARAD